MWGLATRFIFFMTWLVKQNGREYRFHPTLAFMRKCHALFYPGSQRWDPPTAHTLILPQMTHSPPSEPESTPEPWVLALHDDHWFRHVIEGSAMNAAAPRVKPRYIQNHLETVEGRPWSAEISGRLLSKAEDIEAAATAAATERNSVSIRFRHVMYVKVGVVRQDLNLNVFSEPNADPAHANLVAYTVPMAPEMTPALPPKPAHEFIKRIASLFLVCEADDLSPLEGLRLPPISAANSSSISGNVAPSA